MLAPDKRRASALPTPLPTPIMSTLPPSLGRTPSIDQQKGPVAARRHLPIQPLNIPTAATPPATTTTTTSTTSTTTASNSAATPSLPASSTSPPVIPIPFNSDNHAVPHLPVDLGSVPVTFPRSAEQRMAHEGGVLASAAEDLRVFAEPVPLNSSTQPHTTQLHS